MLKPSLYWFLVFVPISLIVMATSNQPVAVFATACVALVPLAGLIGRATDQLAIWSGPRVGGLLNATFANVPELIVAVFLVRAGDFDVVKAALIGSILGNLVLVLGASYLAGGLRFPEQRFNARAARDHSVSLLLAVTGLVMPGVFVFVASETASQVEVVSVTIAGVLILLYCASLLFTFVTHAHLFPVRVSDEVAEWPAWLAIVVLLVAGLLVGLESELLVASLDPTVAALHLSPVFVGLFIIAIVGNVAEHASAVVFALRDKMDVAIEIAFSSASQVALFVAPLLVFLSLAMGRPMNFVFSLFEVAVVALATVIVLVVSANGRSNWLQGLQLLGVYVIMGVSLFYIGNP